MNISQAFAAFAFVYCAVAAGGLYWFFGPDGRNLHAIGIGSALELVAFPLTGAIAAWFFAGALLSAQSPSPRPRFLRGMAIGVLTFLTCVVIHSTVVAFQTDLAAAFWLFVAVLLFGGLSIGLPGALLAGIVAVKFGNGSE